MFSGRHRPIVSDAGQKASGNSHKLQQSAREKLLREVVETSPLEVSKIQLYRALRSLV